MNDGIYCRFNHFSVTSLLERLCPSVQIAFRFAGLSFVIDTKPDFIELESI